MNQGKLGVQYFAQGYELGNETQSGGPAVSTDTHVTYQQCNPKNKSFAQSHTFMRRQKNKQTNKKTADEGRSHHYLSVRGESAATVINLRTLYSTWIQRRKRKMSFKTNKQKTHKTPNSHVSEDDC